MSRDSNKPSTLLGKPIVHKQFDQKGIPFKINTMDFNEYIAPYRIPLTITRDENGFTVTATNLEDAELLEQIIKKMLEDAETENAETDDQDRG